MVVGVDEELGAVGRLQDGGQAGARHEADGMVVGGPGPVARTAVAVEMLDEGAAHQHVEELQAATHAQDRHVAAAGRDERRMLERVALRLDVHRLAHGMAVPLRRDVSAAGQQQAVHRPERDGVVGGVVGAEGIGADEFGQTFGAMRLGHPLGAHLMQHHADTGIGDLPGGFRAG